MPQKTQAFFLVKHNKSKAKNQVVLFK